jgi:hypothetical protein
LVKELPDVSIDMSCAGLTEFVLAEPTRLDGETPDVRRTSGLNVPNTVADNERTSGIDVEATHGGHENFGVGFGTTDVISRSLTVDGVVGVERLAKDLELIIWSRRGEHNRQAQFMDLSERLGGAWKGPNVTRKLLVVLRARLDRSGAIVTKEPGDQLIPAHPYESVDGVHGRPLSGIPKRPRPGQCVEIIRVAQGAVYVEEHPGSQCIDHAGGSDSRLRAALSSPVRCC